MDVWMTLPLSRFKKNQTNNSLAYCIDRCIIVGHMLKLHVAVKAACNDSKNACFLVRPNDVPKYLFLF